MRLNPAELNAERERFARLRDFLRRDPANRPLRQEIFDLALQLGEFDVAQPLLEQVLMLDAEAADWRHNLAVMHLARADYRGAERALHWLIDHGHSAPAVFYNLAWALFCQSRPAEALAIAQPLLEGAQCAPALTLSLRCLHHLGRLHEGLTLFEAELAGGHAVEADALGVAALLAFDLEHFDLAAAWSQRALQGAPRNAEALITAGSLALAAQDLERATALLRRALKVRAGDGRSWSGLAMCALLSGQFDAARDAFERSLVAMPRHIGSWLGLGWCQILRHDIAAARAAFAHALELDHNFGESHGGLAVVLALQGHAALAADAVRRALGLDPRSLSARYAQSVLAGETEDRVELERLAAVWLKDRQGPDGTALIELVRRRRPGPA